MSRRAELLGKGVTRMDWSSFVPGLISTLVGAFLGFGFALWFDRGRRLRSDRAEKERRRREREDRETEYLRNAMWSIEENHELTRQLDAYVRPVTGVLPIIAFRMNRTPVTYPVEFQTRPRHKAWLLLGPPEHGLLTDYYTNNDAAFVDC